MHSNVCLLRIKVGNNVQVNSEKLIDLLSLSVVDNAELYFPRTQLNAFPLINQTITVA